MSKVTSKLQVTLPKAIAEQVGIKPGDEIDWEVAGDIMRVIPVSKKRGAKRDSRAQLRLFDQASQRQRQREAAIDLASLRTGEVARGWTREDLYTRGGTG